MRVLGVVLVEEYAQPLQNRHKNLRTSDCTPAAQEGKWYFVFVLTLGPAKKVTIYVNEDTHYHHRPLHQELIAFLLRSGVCGATAMRAMAGFGVRHVLHTPRIEALAEHLPVVIEFVESEAKVRELLPALNEMVTHGLIEVQDTAVVKAAAPDPPG
jgi:uncharacterized protein